MRDVVADPALFSARLLSSPEGDVVIRPAATEDDNDIWRLIESTIRAGETYPLPRDLTKTDALAYWRGSAHEVHVAETEGTIAGTYYLRANNQGGGAHVANCGYIVAASAPGAASRVRCARTRSRERGSAASGRCNSISSSAAMNARSGCGRAAGSRSSAACRMPSTIRGWDWSMLW